VSNANHELSLWLDEPEGWQGACNRKYLFADQPREAIPGDGDGKGSGSVAELGLDPADVGSNCVENA